MLAGFIAGGTSGITLLAISFHGSPLFSRSLPHPFALVVPKAKSGQLDLRHRNRDRAARTLAQEQGKASL